MPNDNLQEQPPDIRDVLCGRTSPSRPTIEKMAIRIIQAQELLVLCNRILETDRKLENGAEKMPWKTRELFRNTVEGFVAHTADILHDATVVPGRFDA